MAATATKKAKFDAYEAITASIVESLEQGVKPWQRPWNGASEFPIRATGEPYKGINILVLWCESMKHGYASPRWMTYKQAASEGLQVRKGEKGTKVLFFTFVEKDDKDRVGEKITFPIARAYTVFNMDQIDGDKSKFDAQDAPKSQNPGERVAEVEKFFRSIQGLSIRPGLARAFYSPTADYVGMPKFESFVSPEAYYSTLSHEAIHWTGHESRLDRLAKAERKDYAFEELVAEIGASFLMARFGLSIVPDKAPEESVSYIAGWLKALENDKRFVVQAASAATKAVEYLIEQTA